MGWHPDALWPSENPRQPSPHGFLDPFLLIADAAKVTQTMRLGVAVTDIFRRPPAVLAQTALTLAHLSEGRFVLGIGMGEAENLTPYGLPFTPSASRMAEFVMLSKRLMSERGPWSFEGRHYEFDRAVLNIEEPAGGIPGIWLAGSGPRGLRNVARHGDGWIPLRQPLSVFEEKVEFLDKELAEVGRSRSELTLGMVGWTIFAETHEAAHQLMQSPLVKYFALFAGPDQYAAHGGRGGGNEAVRQYIPTHLSEKEARELVDGIPDSLVHDYLLHGTGEDVLEQLRPYSEVGLDHPVVWNISYFGDRDSIGESFRQQAALLAKGSEVF